MTTGNPISHLIAVQMQGKGSEARVVTVLGVRILFSYETPVAFLTPDLVRVVLEAKHSRTTRKHISAWKGEAPALLVDETQFPGLLRSAFTKALRETPPSGSSPTA